MICTEFKPVIPVKSDFSEILRKRVNQYFNATKLSMHCNRSMIIKTIIMVTIFLAPIVILNTGLVESIYLLFGLYIISGLGMAGIGMNVMHDAIHGSYSKNRTVNSYLGYTMNLIGANASVWKIQHNVLHHTYTNIDGHDDDINTPTFLRFSPNSERNWIHKFQHYYVWIFYGLSTVSWITAKDFIRIFRYKRMGFLKRKNEFKKEILKLTAWKIFYYLYILVLPIIILPFSPWIVILAFLIMHFITGLIISSVFQTAHIMPNMTFPVSKKSNLIGSDWSVHQLLTTTNYAPKNRILSWMIGSLNFQIEHHLFPNICHIHYRKISNIVKKTALEFSIPYHTYNTFSSAIRGHFKMLRYIGKYD